MNHLQARAFIERVINSPSTRAAQRLVDSNRRALDATFFEVLDEMIREALSHAQFGSNLFSSNLPGVAMDYLINRNQQASQRLQALNLLHQYASAQRQTGKTQPARAPRGGATTPLRVTCRGCGQTHPVLCPGFNRHVPGPSVVAGGPGGVCNACGAEFSYVTCMCGTVTLLSPADEDDEDEGEDVQAYDDSDAGRPPAAAADGYEEIRGLFDILKQQYANEKASGRMDATRASGLDDIMESLGEMIANERPGKSLEEMTSDRARLDVLMQRMRPRIEKPTLDGPQLPEDSRAAKVFALIQDLKSFVAAENMRQRKSEGETEKAQELFVNAARLTTRLHETRGDDDALVALETDQARSLVNEIRLFARRHYLTLARPVWSHGNVTQNPNLLFYSGPGSTLASLERAAARVGLTVNRPARLGADVAEARWQDLRAASLGVFDVSTPSPQVFYELGIAYVLGTELLLVAGEGTNLPFDISQNVHHYADAEDLDDFLSSELDTALYGLQCGGSDGSSLAASVAYAGRLAEAAGGGGMLRVALDSLRKVGSDPVAAPAAFSLLNTFLGEHAHLLLYPRKPAVYPDPADPSCFIVMPFRDDPVLNRAYQTITRACEEARVRPVRGDVAPDQEIIKSIWIEIGRATHVTVDLTGFNPNVCLELGIADALGRRTLLVAAEGTDALLKHEFPSVAKRRCHTYPHDPASKPAFVRALSAFLNSAAP